MSGRYVRLAPGRYTLNVKRGHGPAGVQRPAARGHIIVGVQGGRIDFEVDSDESAYYWWRGPNRRPGVRLLGIAANEGDGADESDGDGDVDDGEDHSRARRRWSSRSTGLRA